MKTLFILSALVLFFEGPTTWASTRVASLVWKAPPSFEIEQRGITRETRFLTVKHALGSVQLFARPIENMDPGFGWMSETRVLSEGELATDGIRWKWTDVSYTAPSPKRNRRTQFSTAFQTEDRGFYYYGYASARSQKKAHRLAHEFLKDVQRPDLRSLTPEDYIGKKYYLGFGDKLSGSMGNEVKYDIEHTHKIFTTSLGGNYVGTKVIKPTGEADLVDYWEKMLESMTFYDMYVQYSSGHGYESGLAFGVSYDQIRDAVLQLPAKEMIVFIMACHSGGLVDSFNRKKAVWQNYQDWKRTLFVLASSRTSQTSSTGPGTDKDEPGGPSGSAGSAFGHALWKSLIGYADGYQGGVKDGFISIGEIIDFSIDKTEEVGGHTPVYTGSFSRDLILNRVPTVAEIAALGPSTEGLSEAEVAERVKELDQILRIH